MLALFTSASRPPPSCTASARAVRCPGSETSPGMAITLVFLDSSERAPSRASSPRASMIKFQSSSARARASARPRPREAPVISAVRRDSSSFTSYPSRSWLNTMYLSYLRRETSGGTVFGLYQSTGLSLDLCEKRADGVPRRGASWKANKVGGSRVQLRVDHRTVIPVITSNRRPHLLRKVSARLRAMCAASRRGAMFYVDDG